VDDHAFGFAKGLRVRASQCVFCKDRELSEHVAGAEHRENYLTTSLRGARDLHISACNKVQMVARIAFAKNL
jgi:hypothetical protein